MRIDTVEYKVYKYNELTDEAKEKAKQWYLDGQSDLSFIFTEDCEMDLENLFGKNDLEVEYSLGYCQGDGFNIYGEINAENIFDCLEKHNGGTQLKEFENLLTDKEKRTILCYQKECNNIKLPQNGRYGYCMADYIDIVDDWTYDLEEYSCFSNINKDVLEKFEYMVKEMFGKLCKDYEEAGYKFFYEINDEDMEDVCDANDYEFLVDGTFYHM